jgi:hypothetical protein
MLCASGALREPIPSPEPLSEETQGDILRASDWSAIERRLGNVARILLDGGEGDVGPSAKFRTSDLGFN